MQQEVQMLLFTNSIDLRMTCADDISLVTEMLKYYSLKLQAALFDYFNTCLDQGKFDES